MAIFFSWFRWFVSIWKSFQTKWIYISGKLAKKGCFGVIELHHSLFSDNMIFMNLHLSGKSKCDAIKLIHQWGWIFPLLCVFLCKAGSRLLSCDVVMPFSQKALYWMRKVSWKSHYAMVEIHGLIGKFQEFCHWEHLQDFKGNYRKISFVKKQCKVVENIALRSARYLNTEGMKN